MKKLRSFFAVLLCLALALSSVSFGLTASALSDGSFSGRSFQVTDLVTGKPVTFKASSGKPAVLVYGGVGSCGNTNTVLALLTEALGSLGDAAPAVYVIDIKYNTDAFIRDAAREIGLPAGVCVASDTSLKGADLCWPLVSAIGGADTYGFTMPLVAFFTGDGVLVDGYTADTSQKRLNAGLTQICDTSALTAAYFDLPIEAKWLQTEARQALGRVNALRTGSGAWYWNETDTEKVVLQNLSPLTYDYALEKVAQQRAMELIVLYSHSRPSGELCFGAYEDAGYVFFGAGENIAWGQRTVDEVETDWEEENEPHAGQGHRRNMLEPTFRAFACAAVEYQGRRYWVQEFSDTVNDKTAAPANDAAVTAAVRVTRSSIAGWTADVTQLELEAGKTADLSKTVHMIALMQSGGRVRTALRPIWTAADPTVATVSGETVTANKAGGTVLSAAVESFTPVNIKLTVTAGAAPATPEDPTPENPTPEDPTPENPTPDDPTPEDPTPDGALPGDVDADGEVRSGDARLALRASVKLEAFWNNTDAAAFKAADVDKNGKITADDARHILRASVKLEDPAQW